MSLRDLRRNHPAPKRSAIYHDAKHTLAVREMAYKLARGRGLSREQAVFISEVALLHDWDPTRKAGTPARVPETLRALRLDFAGKRPLLPGHRGSVLKQRFGWSQTQLEMALAMIQRTEFPFGSSHPNPHYKRRSPLARYSTMVARLPREAREFVLREAPILSEYPDKSSSYALRSFDKALPTVKGLVNEINNAAGSAVVNTRSLDTPRFLRSLGQPLAFEHDYALARRFGVKNFNVPTRREALSKLGRSTRATFAATQRGFSAYQRTLEAGGSERQAVRAGRAAYRRVRARARTRAPRAWRRSR
ncbi:MAG: HD domain-containing protein [Myxococcales bacterium]|nr:HD domain-containing protein [Myxococcales bacterium]